MTATQDGSLLSRLTNATNCDAIAGVGTRRKPADLTLHERALNTDTREAITEESVGKLIEQLTLSSDRLQGAMHRIGFLESQIESMEGQLSFLPDFRAKAARCIVLEKENQELKAVIEHRNLQLLKRERLLDERNQQLSILEKILAAYKKHLSMVEADLSRLENSSWVRFCAWFTGSPLK